MIEMNPYYARESEVGLVFDVATFSRLKALAMGLSGLVFGVLVGAAALYVWQPNSVLPHAPKWIADGNRETLQLWKDYPLGTPLCVGGVGLFAAIFLGGSLSYLFQTLTGDFYVRVGEGGVSFRVPQGFSTLALDLTWDEILKLTVTQEKQLGSLSRNVGNIGGHFTIRTRSHGNVFVCLNDFREPAHLIHRRIQEARDTRPAELVASY
jgi:hypothetical protein